MDAVSWKRRNTLVISQVVLQPSRKPRNAIQQLMVVRPVHQTVTNRNQSRTNHKSKTDRSR